jgi:hypothetical protein
MSTSGPASMGADAGAPFMAGELKEACCTPAGGSTILTASPLVLPPLLQVAVFPGSAIALVGAVEALVVGWGTKAREGLAAPSVRAELGL